MDFFDVNTIFFTIWSYPMSHLEFWCTLTGALAVWLLVKENIWAWIVGIVNVSLAFVMFYQIQLYPDMFLQVFFLVTNFIGFWQWKYPKDKKVLIQELKISRMINKDLILLGIISLSFTGLFGLFSKNLNEMLPQFFSKPSSFPFLDSFTTIMSIIATFLSIRKKIESWWLWLLIDVISTYMYYIKDIKFYALLYLILVGMALIGAIQWTKTYNLAKSSRPSIQ